MLFVVSLFFGGETISPAVSGSDTISVCDTTEYEVTSSSAYETTPTLGNDGTTDWLVYTVRPMVRGNLGPADIWHRKLDENGAPTGMPIQVSSALTDDQLNDVSGDYIVYTAYESTTSSEGTIMLYQISTRDLQPLGSAEIIGEPRIHGSTVVWREGGGFSARLMLYDLSWIGTATEAKEIAGAPTFEVQIGNRFIVWSKFVNGQFDIVAYDLQDAKTISVASDATVDEMAPSTSGPWVVWEEKTIGEWAYAPARINLMNLDTGETRVIADNGAINSNPSIDGDLISWESNLNGNYDIFIYRISTGETFQVATEAQPNRYMHVRLDYRKSAQPNGLVERSFSGPLDLSGCNEISFDVKVVSIDDIDQIDLRLRKVDGVYTKASVAVTSTKGFRDREWKRVSFQRTEFDDATFGQVDLIQFIIHVNDHVSVFFDNITCNPDIIIDDFEGYTIRSLSESWHGAYDVERVTWDGSPSHYLNDVFDMLVAYVDQRFGTEDIFIASLAFPDRVHNLDTGMDFVTIQAAIDHVETLNGHTIQVDPGIYNENVYVYKQLNIYGAGAGTTIVKASDPNDDVFHVKVDKVNISGFTVEGATGQWKAGILLFYSDNSRIQNIIASNNNYGIHLLNSDRNAIKDNIVSSNGYGIELNQSSYNVVNNNEITNNNVYGIRVLAAPASYNNVTNNNIVNNITLGDGAGIYVKWGDNTLIAGNTIKLYSYGISLDSSTNNTITGNTVTKIGLYGILCYKSGFNNVSNNKALLTDYGILLRFADNNNVVNNTANFNHHGGTYVLDSTNNSLTGNTVDRNRIGIKCHTSEFINIENNKALRNEIGIVLQFADNNNVVNNTANFNNQHGIYIDSSSYNVVSENVIEYNSLNGMKLTSAESYNNLTSNNISNNGQNGIYFEYANDTLVAGNFITNNTDTGIRITGNNLIYNNYFSNTVNAIDDGDNSWNITKTSGSNILGGSYLGGNFWSDYTGNDVDGDGLGDTNLPYSSSGNIVTGGDYLPLVPNTPVGTNISVEFPEENVTITFENVTKSGQTSVDVSTTGPSPPSGFNLSGNYYDITTDATYTGIINVCISYDESQVGDESTLTLFHYENGNWVNVTTYLDTDANVICGEVTSFSLFIVAERPQEAPFYIQTWFLAIVGAAVIAIVTIVAFLKLRRHTRIE